MNVFSSRLIMACCGPALFAAELAAAAPTVLVQVAGDSTGALTEKIEQVLALRSLSEQDGLTAADVVATAQSDYARIVELLYSEGYYSVSARILLDGQEAALINPLSPPTRIARAVIDVQPGRQFRLGRFEINPRVQSAGPDTELDSGSIASATAILGAVRTSVDDWRGEGYAKAEVARQDILARHSQAVLDVDVRLNTGPRVTFGDVIVTGKSNVTPARVRQIAGIPRGEVFDPDDVDKAASRLRKSGAFRSVQITEADVVQPDGNMDIEVTVVDQKPRRIGGGVEFSSRDGLSLSGFWLHRNVFGGAERFRVDGDIAQIATDGVGTDYTLSFRFEKPAVYGPDTKFFAQAELAYRDDPDVIERKASVTLGASREFNDRLTGDLGIGYSRARITDLFATPQTTRDLRVLSFPTSLTFDTRDDALDATRGLYVRGGVTPFHEFVRGQSDTHVSFDARAYREISSQRSVVIAGRLQLGAVTRPSPTTTPPEFLFHSGGSGTVRGQPSKSLGNTVGIGSVGGTSFAAVSAEIRVPVNDTLGIVAFADAGFVGRGVFGTGNWHSGAGLGVRYKTPVGPLRIDLAVPVSGGSPNNFELYIGIGQAF